MNIQGYEYPGYKGMNIQGYEIYIYSTMIDRHYFLIAYYLTNAIVQEP